MGMFPAFGYGANNTFHSDIGKPYAGESKSNPIENSPGGEKRSLKMEVGTKVSWSSQAGGRTTTKVGEIVEVIPAGVVPSFEALKTKFQAIDENGGGASSRGRTSYIVLVPGKSKRSKPKLYWPLPSKLTLHIETPILGAASAGQMFEETLPQGASQ